MKKRLAVASSSVIILTVLFLIILFQKKAVIVQHDDSNIDQKILIGGVVPHHNLVEQEIERFWQVIAQRYPNLDVVILVGPDHEDEGRASLSLLNNPNFLKEDIQLESDSLETLLQNENTAIENDVFRDEHAIQIHLPYIKQEYSNANILPILIRSDASLSDILSLATLIQEEIKTKNVAVIASIDFSHYQNLATAESNDQITWAAIQAYEYVFLKTLDPDYIDSDQSIIFLSETVCPSHDCKWEQLWHGNSAEFGMGFEVTTSYFSLLLASGV